MTIEDAIKWLKVEQCCVSEEGNGKELIEAYNMAIKALEIELLTDKEQRIFLKAMSRE